MKEINIICNANGTADLTTSSIHIDNENNASKLIIDFSNVPSCIGLDKWVDLILPNDTSLRYDLGNDDIVELSLENFLTVKGYVTVTPFALDTLNDIKIKFYPNKKLKIFYQAEVGEKIIAERDDYIASLVARIEALEAEIL